MGLFSLLIGEPYVTIFSVWLRRQFTEVRSKWLGYEIISWSYQSILLKREENA
ncbi:hypothetical protein Goari_023951, partial [Gossypium aridum]|nr:hypothetical protein [Gossypium aridum]